MDPSDNMPVVVFVDDTSTSQYRVRIIKWSSGVTWTDLGYMGSGQGGSPSLVVDPSDNRVIAVFQDADSNPANRAHILKRFY